MWWPGPGLTLAFRTSRTFSSGVHATGHDAGRSPTARRGGRDATQTYVLVANTSTGSARPA